MEECANGESDQHAYRCTHTCPPARIVNVPNQPIVDGLVPLTPVLTQVSSIPPVTVEATISKLSQLSPKIQVYVESAVKDGEPGVSSRD